MTWLKRHKTSIDPSGFLRALSSKMSLIHNHHFNFNTQQDVPEILQVLLDEITGTSVLANNFLKTTIRTSISCTSCLCDSENEESVCRSPQKTPSLSQFKLFLNQRFFRETTLGFALDAKPNENR